MRGLQDKSQGMTDTRGGGSMPRRTVDEEEHLKIHGELSGGIGKKIYLHRLMDSAKNLEL